MEDVPTQPIVAAVPENKNIATPTKADDAKKVEPSKPTEASISAELKGVPPSFLAGMKKKNPLHMRMNKGQKFHSPTDNMMSPCTQKLMNDKKHTMAKGMHSMRPQTLSGTFQKINQESASKPESGKD